MRAYRDYGDEDCATMFNISKSLMGHREISHSRAEATLDVAQYANVYGGNDAA